jgi:hypothetical protein
MGWTGAALDVRKGRQWEGQLPASSALFSFQQMISLLELLMCNREIRTGEKSHGVFLSTVY